MSRKKKQKITMLVALLCLIGIGIGYVYASRYANEKQAKEEAEANEDDSVELYSYEEDALTQIQFENSDTEMTLVYEDDKWYKADEKKFPLDQEKAETMASQISTLISSRMVLEDPENLEDYGLDVPELTIHFTTKDKEEVTIYLGDESSAAGGYYGYTSLSDTIYIITESVYESYQYTAKQMIEMEDIPGIDAETITNLHVKPRKGEEFKAVYDEKNAVSKDIYGWDITKPFAEPVAGDVYALKELFANYTSLSYQQCEDYSGKKDAKYGLAEPRCEVALQYYVEVPDDEADMEEDADTAADTEQKMKKVWYDYNLLIGDKDKSGAYYYVKPKNSERVYTMEASVVENMIQIKPMNYLYAYLYVGTVYELNAIDMSVDGKDYHMELVNEKKEDDTTDAFKATINGKEVDEEAFRLNYGSAGALKYAAMIDESIEASDEPYCTITMIEDEREVCLKFLPYDDKSYRVNINGQQLFTTDKAAVDSLVKGFVDLAGE